MSEVHIELIAYTKFILHAAKYPHCAVNGLLIAENKGKGNKDDLVIVDAVPLFHHSHNLAPMAEVALTKVDLDTQANKRMIVGYYAACENFNDKTPEKCPSQKIAEKIVEFFPKAIFLVIENSKILPYSSTTPASEVKGFRYSDNKWRPVESESLSIAWVPEKLNLILLAFNGIKKLVDFDNYLDDITLDWTNSEVEEMINNNLDDGFVSNNEPTKAKLNNDYDDDDDVEEESSQESSE